jgi:serine/threonine protein phosphatase PrpC
MLRVVEEAARTDTGRQRHTNEDAYFARSPAYAVADGMGGAQAGEVAAGIAAEAFETQLPDSGTPEERLTRVASEANRKIYELAKKDSSRSGMGTTLTAALLADDEISIVHVGDSRAYLFRDGSLRQLTRDHSLVEELRRHGRITTEEAEEHPQRSIITRALGPDEDVDPDVQTHQVRSGDVFVLCSDGLTSMVREERMHEILAGKNSLQDAVDALVDEANAAGGRDNITVLAFRVADTDQAAAPAEQELEDTQTELESRRVREAVASAPPPPPAPRRRRIRWKVVAIVAVCLLVLAGATVGAVAAVRNVYFIGQDDRGLVTLYRGLPYDLPLGVKLYDQRYVSSVQAGELRPFERRRLLDHELRGKVDAARRIRALEEGQ